MSAPTRKQALQLPEFDPETLAPNKNWTKISNRLIDDLYPDKVSGELQMTLILWIARETWGTEEKRPWANLTFTRMCDRFKCTRQALATAIQDAVARELAEVQRVGRANRYRLTPQRWRNAKKYTAPKPPKVDENMPARIDGNQLVLFPGKNSRPIPLRLLLKDREPVDLQVEYHNHAGVKLSFAVDQTSEGLVFIVRPDSTAGEEKANDRPSGLDQFSRQTVENTQTLYFDPALQRNGTNGAHSASAGTPGGSPGNEEKRVGVVSPEPPPDGQDAGLHSGGDQPSHEGRGGPRHHTGETAGGGDNGERKSLPLGAGELAGDLPQTDAPLADNTKRFRILNEYREFLNHLRLKVWGLGTDDDFLRRAVKAADGTPVEIFQQRLGVRFGLNYERALLKHRPGLLLEIIADGAQDYKARMAQEQNHPPDVSPFGSAEEASAHFQAWVNSLPPDDYAELLHKAEPELATELAKCRNGA